MSKRTCKYSESGFFCWPIYHRRCLFAPSEGGFLDPQWPLVGPIASAFILTLRWQKYIKKHFDFLKEEKTILRIFVYEREKKVGVGLALNLRIMKRQFVPPFVRHQSRKTVEIHSKHPSLKWLRLQVRNYPCLVLRLDGLCPIIISSWARQLVEKRIHFKPSIHIDRVTSYLIEKKILFFFFSLFLSTRFSFTLFFHLKFRNWESLSFNCRQVNSLYDCSLLIHWQYIWCIQWERTCAVQVYAYTWTVLVRSHCRTILIGPFKGD